RTAGGTWRPLWAGCHELQCARRRLFNRQRALRADHFGRAFGARDVRRARRITDDGRAPFAPRNRHGPAGLLHDDRRAAAHWIDAATWPADRGGTSSAAGTGVGARGSGSAEMPGVKP